MQAESYNFLSCVECFFCHRTPVPPWVKSYFTTNTLPRTIATLHATAKKMVRDDGSVKPQFCREIQQTLKYHDDAHERSRREPTRGSSSLESDPQTPSNTQARGSLLQATVGDSDTRNQEVHLHSECGLAGESVQHTHISRPHSCGNNGRVVVTGMAQPVAGSAPVDTLRNSTALTRDGDTCCSYSDDCYGRSTRPERRSYWTMDQVGCGDYDDRTLEEAYRDQRCESSRAGGTEGTGRRSAREVTRNSGFSGRLKSHAHGMFEKLWKPWCRGRKNRPCAAILSLGKHVVCTRLGRRNPALSEAARHTNQYCLCGPGVFTARPVRFGRCNFTHASDLLAYFPLATRVIRALEAVLQIQEQPKKPGHVPGVRFVASWPWWGCRHKELQKDKRRPASSPRRAEVGCQGRGDEDSSNAGPLTRNRSMRGRSMLPGVAMMSMFVASEALRWAVRLGLSPEETWCAAGKGKSDHEASKEKMKKSQNKMQESFSFEADDLWPSALFSSVRRTRPRSYGS